MGRRYHYPKKVRHPRPSLLATIVTAFVGSRHHGGYRRKPSLKRSILSLVLNRLARRFH